MSALLAEQWFQALRQWHTRTVRLPRPRPWKPRGPVAWRRPGRCSVCRSARVEKYDELIRYTIATGKDLKKALRLIAEELGVGLYQVEWHLHNCVLPLTQWPPARLVGEWADGGIEYVETPAGWLRSSRIMAAIREHPESKLLLSIMRLEMRRRTLLRRHGYYRDEVARKIGQSLLDLAKSLDTAP